MSEVRLDLNREEDQKICEQFIVIDWNDDKCRNIEGVIFVDQEDRFYKAYGGFCNTGKGILFNTDPDGRRVVYNHYGDIKLVWKGEKNG